MSDVGAGPLSMLILGICVIVAAAVFVNPDLAEPVLHSLKICCVSAVVGIVVVTLVAIWVTSR